MLYIFDKDLTLVAGVNGHCANTPEEQAFLPGVWQKCRDLKVEGHVLACASNQGGIEAGFVTTEQVQAMMQHVQDSLNLDATAYCPHFRFPCECRKPKPGMLNSLMSQLGFSASDTMFVGDSETDRQAAQAAGCAFVWAHEFFGYPEGAGK